MKKLLLFVLIYCALAINVMAKGVYQTPEEFLQGVFTEQVPAAQVLWLSAEDKALIADILSHKYKRMRVRYWQKGHDNVWILNEIGKEKPITIAVHIYQDAIQQLKVLTFRETRGDEVRHEFFSKQFIDARLAKDKTLSQHIDGITGATLSVRATTKVARLALWLNSKVTH
jgi:uncharacterized protein with FMN-binding domain